MQIIIWTIKLVGVLILVSEGFLHNIAVIKIKGRATGILTAIYGVREDGHETREMGIAKG